ncbi:nucleoside triphosphate pyrophosphohydrolase [Geothermobacter hydrogeniphilus]|uniref:nucleoside triphosphate pyrophosphohydrolase n=1 Tax=Geothermobacter hydrogeniphilus TaxID=1969733 RepID=UPI001304B328|nr:nucleoside triphosphate pyrophosphohydrolase [Geothermobacter hydrogeniphilus]
MQKDPTNNACESTSPTTAIERLLRIMAALRAPGGCPWDVRQSPESLRPYILEEAYEAVEAISSGDMHNIRDELGDLLLQVVFQAQIFAEKGEFNFNDIADTISNKLIRRHPHVFADATFQSEEELHRQWDAIKRQERGGNSGSSCYLDDITTNLPALMKAQKLVNRMAKGNAPLPQDITSLVPALSPRDNGSDIHRRIGDLLFSVVTLAGKHGCDAETALLDACRRVDATIHGGESRHENQPPTADGTRDEPQPSTAPKSNR